MAHGYTAVGDIPPTRAFSKVWSGNSSIQANKYNANLTISPGTGITIEVFSANNTLKINANNSTNSTGYVTAGNNVGAGTGHVFRDKTSTTLNFKTLKAGSNISITNNADDITITSTANTTGFTKANNLNGGDAKIFATNSSNQLTGKTLTAGTGISITNGSKTITISNTGTTGFTNIYGYPGGDARVLRSNSSNTGVLKSFTSGGGISITNGTDTLTISNTRTGESTTGSNLGTSGTGVFSSLVGFDLQFKKLISSTLSITSNSTNVILETISSGFTKINSLNGGTASIVATNQSSQATFKTLTQGTGITITNGTKTVTITNAGVTSIAGTTGNITASAATGSVTLNTGDKVVVVNGLNQTIYKSFTFIAGNKLTSPPNTKYAGINIGIATGNPTSLSNGDLWINGNQLKYRANGHNNVLLSNVTSFGGGANTWIYSNGTNNLMLKTFDCTGIISCSGNNTGKITITAAGSGITKLVSIEGGTARLLNYNSSSTGIFKSLTAARGITITNGTTTITIDAPLKVANQTVSKDFQIVGINNSTGIITRNQFSVNTQDCGSNFVKSIDNATGYVTCAASSSSGITKANNLDGGNAKIFGTNSTTQVTAKTITNGPNIVVTNGTKTLTISANNTAQIVSAGGTTLFKSRDNATQNTIKGLTTTRGITLTGNTNDVQIDTNFKANTKTSATRQFLVSYNNATTDGNFGTTTFGANNISCVAGTHLATFTNSTGVFTCTSDTGGTAITQVNSLDGGTASLIGTNTTTKATTKTLTQGTGITITNGSKTITITNAGVTSISGTSRNITASASSGAITLNTGDNIVTVAGNNQTIQHSITTTAGNKITGTPNSKYAGVNIGIVTADPTSPTDGDLWINSIIKKYRANSHTYSIVTNVTSVGGGANTLVYRNASTNNILLKTFDCTGIVSCSGNNTNKITITSSGGSGFTTIEHISSAGDASTIFSNSSNKAVIKKLAGTANNVTITGNSTGMLSWNLGSNTVVTNGNSQTISKILYHNGIGLNYTKTTTTPNTMGTKGVVLVVDAATGNKTTFLPTSSGNTGQIFVIMRNDSSPARNNRVIIDGSGSELIDGWRTYNLTRNLQTVMIQSTGSAWTKLIESGLQTGLVSDNIVKGSNFNRWYGSATLGSSTTTTTQRANTVTVTPFAVTTATTFDRIETEVTTAKAASTCRLAIYSDSNGYPDRLIPNSDGGTISTASTGRVGNTFAGPITLFPGNYWLAFQCSGGGQIIRAWTTSMIAPVLGIPSTAGASQASLGYNATFTYAAFPDDFPKNTRSTTNHSPAQVLLRPVG